MATTSAFVEATIRYKPAAIKVLFIAEAPPALRFNRLFYFERLRNGDTLFLEMMKTLYGPAVGFTENRFLPGSSALQIRNRKPELLARFMRDGYFLIDASEEPMPDEASPSQKLAATAKPHATAHPATPKAQPTPHTAPTAEPTPKPAIDPLEGRR